MTDERTADELARGILESITDAFFSLDREFRFTYLNRTAQTLLLRRDLVGKNLWEEFPAARGTHFERAYETAMHRAEAVDFVEYYPAPLDRWYQVRAYPAPSGVSVYFQDITERRQAEAEAQRHRDQMELVVRGADVGVWYCPLPFDALIWDAKVKEHFHLEPEAHVTIDTFYERLHPDDREATRNAIAKSIEERTTYDIDYRTCSADGARTKWIRAVGRAFYGADGSPVRFDGVTTDISKRKEAELALRASEERYRLALRATNDVVWDRDLATDEMRWSEALLERFGHAPAEAASFDFWKTHIAEKDRARVVADLEAAIADPGREHWEGEYGFSRADGTVADVVDRGWLVRDESGRGARMIGAMQDRSEQKRAMEAERAARSEAERQSRMKDEFLTTLSHELRTPLNAILGWAHLTLRDGTIDPKLAPQALDVIVRNAKAQANIVDDLLDMSRMLLGKISLDMRRIAVAPLVSAAVDTARPTAVAKAIRLVVEEMPDEVQAFGDAGRLQQVFWNVLSNAVKFTPRGGEVSVSVACDPAEVIVRVRDDGEGIAPDFLPYVFDHFRQADASFTRKHGGLGLGLAIVKRVVELHGGSVTAASAGRGLGATFEIRLPRAGEDVSRTSLSELDEAAESDLAHKRILVVEDDDDARMLLAQLFTEHGGIVDAAPAAAEALAALERTRFDVLVTDIGLPDVDGYELLRRARAIDPGLPAIAVTAYARAEDRARSLAAGFITHIAKPIDGTELVALVGAAARKRSAV